MRRPDYYTRRAWMAEVIESKIGRVVCRLFRYHSLVCRGRNDHTVGGKVIDPGRWTTRF